MENNLKENTRIDYLYRDGSNYKQPNSIVVPGRYSEEQIKTIISCLDFGLEGQVYFVPRKVGFPEKRFDKITDDDVLVFELTEFDFEPTSEKPQIESTPEEIVELFKKNKGHWEEGVYLW